MHDLLAIDGGENSTLTTVALDSTLCKQSLLYVTVGERSGIHFRLFDLLNPLPALSSAVIERPAPSWLY